MRIKRAAVNKRQRLRLSLILLLFILVLPILSFYLSQQLLYKIVTPLYKRLEPASADAIDSYEISPLIYYEIYINEPEIFPDLYLLNEDGLIACTLSKEETSTVENFLTSKGIETKVEEQRAGSITVAYLKNNKNMIESLNKCIRDIISIIDKESELSLHIINGSDSGNNLADLLKRVENINNVLESMTFENNELTEIEDFVRLQKEALGKLEISIMLNDDKSFYIIQEVIYKSLNLYKMLMLRLEDIELYNF
ncbi:MAG: hypothetical protein QME46_05025 [Thermoanaerobacteraceae bacterium]|nr:hypothetical protein [Thermoanaerobacteraceae bacterium]